MEVRRQGHENPACAASALGRELAKHTPRSQCAAPPNWLVPPPREGDRNRLQALRGKRSRIIRRRALSGVSTYETKMAICGTEDFWLIFTPPQNDLRAMGRLAYAVQSPRQLGPGNKPAPAGIAFRSLRGPSEWWRGCDGLPKAPRLSMTTHLHSP
jgi:hypothetical protein